MPYIPKKVQTTLWRRWPRRPRRPRRPWRSVAVFWSIIEYLFVSSFRRTCTICLCKLFYTVVRYTPNDEDEKKTQTKLNEISSMPLQVCHLSVRICSQSIHAAHFAIFGLRRTNITKPSPYRCCRFMVVDRRYPKCVPSYACECFTRAIQYIMYRKLWNEALTHTHTICYRISNWVEVVGF